MMDSFESFVSNIIQNINQQNIESDIKQKIIDDIYNNKKKYIEENINNLKRSLNCINLNLQNKSFENKIQNLEKSKTDTLINFDKLKCHCRVFNGGIGKQCNRQAKVNNMCNAHNKKYIDSIPEYGFITDEMPTHELSGKNKGKIN